MRARRRIAIVSLSVLIFVAAVAIVVFLRKQAAPEPARLLPESDAVVYLDFASIRSLTSFDQQPLPRLAPGYEEFVKQTGFAFERDLDEAAMAIHRGAGRGKNRRPEDRYTEVLVGRYDQVKLAQYLRQHARSSETYRDVEIFQVPIENRTVRIALLAIDTVVISNCEERSVINGIVDRFKKVALPFGGPTLVQTYYRRVPLGSLLWAISHLPGAASPTQTAQPGADAKSAIANNAAAASQPLAQQPIDPQKLNPPTAAQPSFTLPGGVDVGLPGSSDVVVSLRMLSTIHARAEFYTANEADAKAFADQTTAFLNLFRSIQSSSTPTSGDEDIKQVFDSIKISHHGERAEVLATIPPSFLRKLVSDPTKKVVEGETQGK